MKNIDHKKLNHKNLREIRTKYHSDYRKDRYELYRRTKKAIQ